MPADAHWLIKEGQYDAGIDARLFIDAACSVVTPIMRPTCAGPPSLSKSSSKLLMGRDDTLRIASRQDETYRNLCNVSGMTEPFERLQRARLLAGYPNATDAARAFGWNEITYRSHENGSRGLKTKVAEQYAKAFKVKVSWLLHGDKEDVPDPVPQERPIPNTDLSKAEFAPPLHSLGGPRNVPVFGTVAGGKRGDADFRMNGETIDYAPRPPGIATKKDVYVLGVTGGSMEPKFEEGERVYVDPHRSPSIMDYVVIQVLTAEDGESHDGFIKRLIRRTPTKIVVSQFNPPREIEFDRDGVKVHRVIPQDELLGL